MPRRKTHHNQLPITTGKGVPFREPTEAELQSAVVEILRKAGYLVIRHNSGGTYDQRGRYVQFYHIFGVESPGSGLPDVQAFKGGHCLMLEIKTRRGKLRPAQTEFRELAAMHGVKVEIIRSVADLERVIRPP